LLDHPRYAKLQIDRQDLEGLLATGDPVLYRGFITGIFDLYGNKHGNDLVGANTPSYVRFILTLHQLWPHAKFVHVIRDGRDVCLSAIDWRGGELRRRFVPLHEDPVTTTAVWWDWQVRTGREGSKALSPDLYHEVRCESLVSKPAEECEKLCDFLGIPYDEGMLRSHEGRERPSPAVAPRGRG
jgi:Sulfotransferase family